MVPAFRRALRDAARGLGHALVTERNLRIELFCAAAWGLAMLWMRPAPVWWALSGLHVGLVLGLELVNTALERLADHVHPERHPEIGWAKDCAAAAVLVASLGSLAFALLVLGLHLA